MNNETFHLEKEDRTFTDQYIYFCIFDTEIDKIYYSIRCKKHFMFYAFDTGVDIFWKPNNRIFLTIVMF